MLILLVSISSKTIPILELDTETQFDKDNMEFNVEFEGDYTRLLFYLTQENKNIKLSQTTYNDMIQLDAEYDFDYPGGGAVCLTYQGLTNYFNITSTDDGGLKKGTIWVNPLNKELNIDLSKEKYEKKFTIKDDEKFGDALTYSVSNLSKDKTFLFNYLSTKLMIKIQ